MPGKTKWVQWMVGLASIGTLVLTTGHLQSLDENNGMLQARAKNEPLGDIASEAANFFEQETQLETVMLQDLMYERLPDEDGDHRRNHDHDDDEYEDDDDEHEEEANSRYRGSRQLPVYATSRPS